MNTPKLFKRVVYQIMQCCFSLFPVKRNRIFFISFYGKSYSDNPKAISHALYKRYGSKFQYIWVLNHHDESVPNYIKTCKYNTLKMLYYMSTSHVWVSNFGLSKGTIKRRRQYYIHTWHGDKAFKKVLHDVPSRDGSKKYFFETDNADFMLAGSSYGERQIRTAFLYQGNILKEGTPRNDIFFTDTTYVRKKILTRYNLTDCENFILYAPTFRRNQKSSPFKIPFHYNKLIELLEQQTNKKWKMLIRTHNADKNRKIEDIDNKYIVSVSDYPDTNEILTIPDILITDYSSIAGDYALTGKLIILYLSDIEQYIEQDRDMYFDIKQSPYFQCYNEESLLNFIKNYNSIDSIQNCKKILDFYGNFETGNASDKISNIINSLYEKK